MSRDISMRRNKRPLYARLLLLLAPILLSVHASAQAEAPIKLATREYLPPYVNDGATAGIEIDLVKAIFDQMGAAVEFVQLPDLRMALLYEERRAAGILTQYINGSGTGCLTDWYFSHENVGISLAAEKIKFSSVSALGQYSVLSFDSARRSFGSEYADAVSKSPQYLEIEDQRTHIGLLYKGRFKIVVGDQWILRLAQKTQFDQTGEFMQIQIHKIFPPRRFGARFYDTKLCERFNQALGAIRQSGQYDSILKKHQTTVTFTPKTNGRSARKEK